MMPNKQYSMQECKDQHGLLEDRPWIKALQCDSKTLSYIQAIQRNGEDITQPPRITLSTIHGAKGGESKNVTFLPDLSWNASQSFENSPDPVHRQYYTGVTRTQHTLYILSPTEKNYYSI